MDEATLTLLMRRTSMNNNPKVSNYTTDPYSARVFILNLEKEYNLQTRIKDGDKYCMICIDKEKKHEQSGPE